MLEFAIKNLILELQQKCFELHFEDRILNIFKKILNAGKMPPTGCQSLYP